MAKREHIRFFAIDYQKFNLHYAGDCALRLKFVFLIVDLSRRKQAYRILFSLWWWPLITGRFYFKELFAHF